MSDPDLFPELNRLDDQRWEKFNTLLVTGAIPVPRGSILISEARLRNLQDYLNQARFEYVMAGVEAKKHREQTSLRKKLKTF